MDDNPVFQKLYKLIENSLTVRLAKCGEIYVKSYPRDYRASWPATVVSFLESGETSGYIFSLQQNSHRQAPSVGILPEKESYKTQIVSPEGANFIWSHIHFRIMESVDLISLLKQPITITETAAVNKIGGYNRELIKLSERKPPLPSEYTRIQTICYDILSIILNHTSFREDAGKLFDTHQRLAPLIQEIAKSYKEQWTIERMTKIACLSRSRLHHVFKSVYGQSPLEYAKAIRLSEARKLLLTTNLQVSEIAIDVGYEDPFYFCRCFTQLFGVSPTQYRKTESQ
jgi:AraC-like DNA-binding protein